MRGTGWLPLLLAAPALGQVEHHELVTKTPLTGDIPNGSIDVAGDHVVVGLWHQVVKGHGLTKLFVLDRAKGETVAELPGGPEEVCLVGATAVVRGGPGAGLHDLATGAKRAELRGRVACDDVAIYSDGGAGRIIRHDPASGRSMWEVHPGKPFGTDPYSIFVLLPVRDGVWAIDGAKSCAVKLGRDGKELHRYEVPAGDRQTELNFTTVHVGPKDLLVACFNGVTLGKDGLGALFRLIGDGKPKDLPLPGGRPFFISLGNLARQDLLWTFERKGKLCAVVEARADGSAQGEPDVRVAVDLRRWKPLPGRSPRDLQAPVSPAGYGAIGPDVWDVAEGKKVASVSAPDARWAALSERHALEWDPEAHAARLVPLAGGEARAVPFPEGTELLEARAPSGGGPIVVVTRAGGKTAVAALDQEAGTVTPVGEVEGPANLVTTALGPVGGRLWLALAAGPAQRRAIHLYGVEVKAAAAAEPKGGRR